MKVILIILLFSFKVVAQTKDFTNFRFSEIFKSYSSKYQKLLILYPGGKGGRAWTHYRIMYNKNGKWFLVDHFSSPIYKDSIAVRKCGNCDSVYQQLIKKENLLKSENEIKAPCREIDRMIFKGDTVIQVIEDLDFHMHIGSQVLEYSINKKEKRIYQTWPEFAIKICPQSFERKTFFDLMAAIKNVK